MKLTILGIVTFLVIINGAFAETEWVTTSFWRAPKKSTVEVKLIPVDLSGLKNKCREFEKRLSYESTPYEKAIFDKFRKTDNLSDDGSFKAIFLIQTQPFKNSVVSSLDLEKLPFFTQSSSVQSLIFSQRDSFSTVAAEESYVSIARELGLEESEVNVFGYKHQDALLITAKDVACDLLNGKAYFTSTVSTVVSLVDESEKALMSFYFDQIQPKLNEVMGKSKETNTVKAALLGFKLGKIIEDKAQNNADDKEVVTQLGNVMNLLFQVNSLENSKNVNNSPDGKKKEILLPLNDKSTADVILKI